MSSRLDSRISNYSWHVERTRGAFPAADLRIAGPRIFRIGWCCCLYERIRQHSAVRHCSPCRNYRGHPIHRPHCHCCNHRTVCGKNVHRTWTLSRSHAGSQPSFSSPSVSSSRTHANRTSFRVAWWQSSTKTIESSWDSGVASGYAWRLWSPHLPCSLWRAFTGACPKSGIRGMAEFPGRLGRLSSLRRSGRHGSIYCWFELPSGACIFHVSWVGSAPTRGHRCRASSGHLDAAILPAASCLISGEEDKVLPRISKRQSAFHCFALFRIVSCYCFSREQNRTQSGFVKRDDLRPGKVCRLGFVQLSQLPVDLGANAWRCDVKSRHCKLKKRLFWFGSEVILCQRIRIIMVCASKSNCRELPVCQAKQFKCIPSPEESGLKARYFASGSPSQPSRHCGSWFWMFTIPLSSDSSFLSSILTTGSIYETLSRFPGTSDNAAQASFPWGWCMRKTGQHARLAVKFSFVCRFWQVDFIARRTTLSLEMLEELCSRRDLFLASFHLAWLISAATVAADPNAKELARFWCNSGLLPGKCFLCCFAQLKHGSRSSRSVICCQCERTHASYRKRSWEVRHTHKIKQDSRRHRMTARTPTSLWRAP